MAETEPFCCVLCSATTDAPENLRFHYSVAHRVDVRQNIAYWPEFMDKPERFVRLCWFRWARLEGWAFAMDEVTA